VFRSTRRRAVSITAAVGVVAASVLVGSHPAFAANDTFDIWYVARTTRHLMVIADNGIPKDTGQVVAANTSPISIWSTFQGPVAYFKKSSDGFLYRYKLRDGTMRKVGTGNGGTGAVVAAGTTAAVGLSWDEFGEYEEVAYQASGSGNLVYVTPDNVAHDTNVKMAPNTSPDINTKSTIFGIEFMMVFTAASDNLLWRLQPGVLFQHVAGGNGGGVVAAAGTSPALARRGEIAYQDSFTHQLSYVDSNDVNHPTGVPMPPDASPDITNAANTGSFFVIMFKNANDGLLYRLDPGFDFRLVANGLGVATGTRPAVTGLGDTHYMVAFTAAGSNNLWYVDENNGGHDTGLAMAPGTSPAANLDCIPAQDGCIIA
jgi:hypothetical protein